MEALLNTIINAFGWSIFHSLWQGAVIYGMLFLILMCKPRISSKLKHNLAFGAICLMFVGFLLTFASILEVPASALHVNLSQQLTLGLNTQLALEPMSLAAVVEQYFPYLVGLYALGLFIQAYIIISGYRRLDSIKQSVHTRVPEDWNKLFKEVLTQLKISKPVRFYLSDKVNVPLVIGFFKPLILFPLSLASQLDMQQVEAILIHELSHIRRNDFLLNLVKTGIETILFFNPFVWLCSKFIGMEREHDCDDLVIRITGTPLTYAHALLKIELIKEKGTPALSLAASGSNQHLYQRIKRITDMKTTYMNAKQRILAIAVTLATIISIAWVSPAKEQATLTVANVVNKMQRLSQTMAPSNPAQLVKKAKLSLPIDSPEKKKKIKIITVDEQGNRKEYSSISELPDSLKQAANYDDFVQFKDFTIPTIDTTTLLALKKHAEDLNKHFNSPQEKARWEKLSVKMEKEGEAFARKFNTPEEQAKWAKVGLELQEVGKAFAQKINTMVEQQKLNKLTDSMTRYAENISAKLNTPEHKEEMRRISDNLKLKSKELQMMMNNPELSNQVNMKLSYKYDLESPESNALKSSEAYKKLKKDFEEKVEKLKLKQKKEK